MPSPLLVTKLYFPTVRQDLVSRPQLVERLQAGLLGPPLPLTCLCAHGQSVEIRAADLRLARMGGSLPESGDGFADVIEGIRRKSP